MHLSSNEYNAIVDTVFSNILTKTRTNDLMQICNVDENLMMFYLLKEVILHNCRQDMLGLRLLGFYCADISNC